MKLPLTEMEKTLGGAGVWERLGFQWGMLSVTSKWSCSLGGWIYETGGQMRALRVNNIQVILKHLKLDEVNNGLSETEKRRGPGTKPRGPSTLTSPETKRNQQKILKKSHQWVGGELGKYSKTVLISMGTWNRRILFSTNFFLWFSESMQINSTLPSAFSFALHAQPFQAFSPWLLCVSGSS